MFEKLDYKCPACKSKLVVSKDTKLYETTSEHVCDPNAEPPARHYLICENVKCKLSSINCFWDWYGDAYGMYNLKDFCIDGLSSPFGSSARKGEIESYKRGLTKKTMLPSWLTLNVVQLYFEYHYKADTDGNVLKKWRTLEFLKKDENGRFCYGGSWWWGTFKYLWKKFKRKRKSKTSNEFEKTFSRASVYRVFEFVMKVIFYKSYKKSLKN